MELKMRYQIYVIAAAVTAAAITFLIMAPFSHENPMPDVNLRKEMLADTTRFLQMNQLKSLEFEGMCLSDIFLRSDSGNVSLYSIVKHPTLVFRYFDINCTDCIQKEATLIKQHTIGVEDRVIFIASFLNYRSMRAYNLANEITQKAFQLNLDQQLGSEIDKNRLPYYFILYPNGKISHFFMSAQESSQYIELYLKGIKHLLME
ncbi:hypothetical protein [Phocaeicola sartorii]|uniref:hypothetical protein n=1 Tax=Phocaeicola sartorii TaxID=671267 RepID=UPI00242C9832|nr:hypothetical protein [Phocaeicola sartorii]